MPSDIGFRVVPAVLSQTDCERLIEDLMASGNRGRAGIRHLMSHPSIAAIATEPRVLALVTTILGAPATPYRATLFDKSQRSNWLVVWHQDTALPLRERFELPGWGPWSTKAGVLYAHAPASALNHIVAVRLHLDESGPHNGPLRIIPGSHLLGVLSDHAIAALVSSAEAVECLVPRGGALLMRPLHVHSSSKSRSEEPRRVIHLEYASSWVLGGPVVLAAA